MDRLKAMQVFVEVADRGSLSAAAVHLDMSRAMVSRYLAEMEQWVGVRLLHRTTRRLSLTPAGAETLPRCRQMLDMVGDLRSAVSTPEDTPRGLLRMTTSMSFGSRHLARLITEYVKLHPGTSVDLMLVDRAVNLVEERVDLAVRITNDLDPNLIARKLAVCRSVVCASPEYLQREGEPARIEDLSLRNCLTHSYFGKSLWRFERDGVPVDVPVSGNISANEVSVLVQAALEGAGVAMLPTYYATEYVAEGRLKVILPHAKPQELGIYGVYVSRRQMPLILRSMLDFLVERLESTPWDTP
ncbi:LysR family transcriptional regulator [Streptomyces cavourensis]|jgi:DNA-binding transcriptional LysR family regulator|uniref:LysR family transcriptional regulator n=1 Tax=unclassified Achromobacter TaxID=2626865 RepID=UPI000DF9B8E9|nr:LysR family transcriptional regulator [Streptomyces cavourensis]